MQQLWATLSLAVFLGGCSFEPPSAAPGPLGTACASDKNCKEGHCVKSAALGVCSVCSAAADCGSNQRCDLAAGRCVSATSSDGPTAVDDQGHRHVGRIATIPISAYRQGASQ
ncbi:MAG: hypothetical protein U1E65_33020 [Myxococcota bacterium]